MGLRDRLRRLVRPLPVPDAAVVTRPTLSRPVAAIPRIVDVAPLGAVILDMDAEPAPSTERLRALAGAAGTIVVQGKWAPAVAERLCALGARDVAWLGEA